MVLTASFVLSLVIGFVATIPAQCKALSRVDASIEASRRHDFSVRIRAARLAAPTRPSHPSPNVRDDRETPLLIGHETREELALICPTAQAGIPRPRLRYMTRLSLPLRVAARDTVAKSRN
jgi:hypothetical protein